MTEEEQLRVELDCKKLDDEAEKKMKACRATLALAQSKAKQAYLATDVKRLPGLRKGPHRFKNLALMIQVAWSEREVNWVHISKLGSVDTLPSRPKPPNPSD